MRGVVRLAVGKALAVAPIGCSSPRVPETVVGTALPASAMRLEELTQTWSAARARERRCSFSHLATLRSMILAYTCAPTTTVCSTRDRLVRRLAAAHPDYHFVMMPVVPLGEGGANDAADSRTTSALRCPRRDLRNVASDLVHTSRGGVNNILIIECHGAQLHNVAFTQAARFVSERYRARMVNVTGLAKAKMAAGGVAGDDILDAYLRKRTWKAAERI